jgi:hypothetical protein
MPTHRSAYELALGRPHRRAQDPDAFRGEDRVERRGEFRVAVTDEKPELAGPIAEAHHQVACGIVPRGRMSVWVL